MRNAFINTILDECYKRDDIFINAGDAGLGVFDVFQKKFPERFLNLGVAEQNAVSFSAGLAMTGVKVYLYNIIPFVLFRCYEQVRNDICYQRVPVVLVGIGSGVTYAPAGMTHYSVEDLGLAQTMPNLTVFSPADPLEAKLAALYSLKADHPVYIRLAKRGEPVLHNHENIDITLPQELAQGQDVAILCHGSIAEEAINARKILMEGGITPKVISLPMLQPLNTDRLFSLLTEVKHVVSVEEHFAHCGLGAILAREYVKQKPAWDFSMLGIPAQFIHDIKDNQGMRDLFAISADKIAGFVKNKIGS